MNKKINDETKLDRRNCSANVIFRRKNDSMNYVVTRKQIFEFYRENLKPINLVTIASQKSFFVIQKHIILGARDV